MSHAIFAQQSSGFIPLAADTVQQAILIAFFVSQHTVFVPDADNAMPATVAQWHHFTKLPITVESFINGLFNMPSVILFNNNTNSTPLTLKIQPRIGMAHKFNLPDCQTPRDEILEANTPAVAGGSKEERKRERLSERPVVS